MKTAKKLTTAQARKQLQDDLSQGELRRFLEHALDQLETKWHPFKLGVYEQEQKLTNGYYATFSLRQRKRRKRPTSAKQLAKKHGFKPHNP